MHPVASDHAVHSVWSCAGFKVSRSNRKADIAWSAARSNVNEPDWLMFQTVVATVSAETLTLMAKNCGGFACTGAGRRLECRQNLRSAEIAETPKALAASKAASGER